MFFVCCECKLNAGGEEGRVNERRGWGDQQRWHGGG